MDLSFFGGANEVGGSSTLIKIDGYRIIVDTGIRTEPNQDSPLPDFPFDKVGMPDAVLLTHAHADHTGALPVLRDLWLAGVKIYWTPATRAITRVSLEHNAQRMQREEQEEGKPPLYTQDDIEVALHCLEKEVPWLDPVPICEGVTATWIPAGHILGAAMIYIEGRCESILITGDVSVTNQRTIPGLVLPSWCKPDVMVMESTYGNHQHNDRIQEENRLIKDVAKTIGEGGKVLIPAFAVGRSQEVISILKRAMELKQLPEFPVYVDGLVRDVNRIYSRFSGELQRELRCKAEHGVNLFYSDAIRPVASRDERNRILSGPPCCIVASSGMLIGGMSSYYAKHLVSNPKNLIAITGYQANGTAGRALLDLAEAGESTDRVWKPNDGTAKPVKSRVDRYSFSAHADRDQLMTLVEKVQPSTLFLVHGDADAREYLFNRVRKTFPHINVRRPQNSHAYTVRKQTGIARGRLLSNDRILSEVSAFVRKMELKGPFSVRELAEIWFGTEAITLLMVKFFEWCLSLEGQFFERRSGDLFSLRQPI